MVPKHSSKDPMTNINGTLNSFPGVNISTENPKPFPAQLKLFPNQNLKIVYIKHFYLLYTSYFLTGCIQNSQNCREKSEGNLDFSYSCFKITV